MKEEEEQKEKKKEKRKEGRMEGRKLLSRIWRNRNLHTLFIAGGNVNDVATVENRLLVPQKVKH